MRRLLTFFASGVSVYALFSATFSASEIRWLSIIVAVLIWPVVESILAVCKIITLLQNMTGDVSEIRRELEELRHQVDRLPQAKSMVLPID